MKKEYDFSKGKRGVVRQLPPEEERARHTKVRITIFLDQDILKFFKSRAAKPGAEPYQTQINRALREYASSNHPPVKDTLLNDEGFIARVSERVAEYSTRKGIASSERVTEWTDSDRHNTLLLAAWKSARSTANSERFKTAFTKEGRNPDEWREAFQLLVACLIYSVNGFKEWAGRGFHEEIWRIPAAYSELFKSQEPRYFGTDFELGKMFGNMHFASMSFRLRTAVLLVHQNIVNGNSPFAGLEKNNKTDWDGSRLEKQLEDRTEVFSIGCCKIKRLEDIAQGDELLRVCLAMIDAHRHHFGHGQKADGKRKRTEHYRSFYRCQVAEAQLRLIEWGLSKLAETAGISR